MVELIGVSKSYNDKKIIDDFNYKFDDTGLYVIKGESGAGKTTLLNIISGRIKADKGKVILKEECFYLPFNNYLVENFTVRENIKLYQNLFTKFKENKDYFDIKSLLDKKASKLSKGETQKVGLHLVVASKCKIILLDEPFANLDYKSRKLAIKILKAIAKTKLVILVSHQPIKERVKIIDLKSKYKDDLQVRNSEKKEIKKFNNAFYFAFLLHKKQWLSKLILVSILMNLLMVKNYVNQQLDEINNEVMTSFEINKSLYYKINDTSINKEEFYDQVILNISKEIAYYDINIYSKEMYDSKVSIRDNYLDNGFLIANAQVSDELDEEVILELDIDKYCLNNNYLVCYKDKIISDLQGEKLCYNKKCFKIKEVINGDNTLFISRKVKNSLLSEYYKEDNQITYNLVIYLDKLDDFYQKINSYSSLLTYDFIYLFNDDEYAYFLVSKSEHEYFSKEEIINNNLMACLEIGVSCSSLDFSKFNSLLYIDDINVEGEISYKKIEKDLGYDEIIISSSLANKLNKKINETINLKFYIDDMFNILDKMKIVDIVDNDELIIYHSKLDYQVFKERFNKDVRVEYVYSEKELENYSKSNLIYYDLVITINDYLNYIYKITKIGIILICIISMITLFMIESSKLKKHYLFFEIISNYHFNILPIYNCYMLWYLFASVIFVLEYELLLIYIMAFILFYLINTIKIKSRYSWIK